MVYPQKMVEGAAVAEEQIDMCEDVGVVDTTFKYLKNDEGMDEKTMND